MSKLKVNELDTESGSTITVTTAKTLDVPAGASLTVSGTQTVTGTVNLTSSTLTLPATLPATAGTNITSIPGANITGTIPLAALSNAPATDLDPVEDDIAVLGFQVAAANDLAKYSLRDQIVDTFQDATGVDAGASTGEERNSSGKYYSGTAAITSSGGVKTTVGSDTIHTFLTTATYTIDTAIAHDILIVAGGGGGSGNDGGGGGAGGVRQLTSQPITAATHAITVGTGGAGATGGNGATGVNSSVVTGSGTLSASGGGGGGGEPNAGTGGGSGGGGAGVSGSAGGAGNAGSYSPVEGYAGGAGTSGAPNYGAGSGGGASAVGGTGTSSPGTNPPAGDGIQNNWQTGSNQWYGGGGGGCGRGGGSPGGQGGGGAGQSTNVAGNPGTANTGGGGGGTYEGPGGPSSSPAGSGGSGIVILRYGTAPGNMTLVSTATTAEAGTTATGDFVILYTPTTGSTVLNTNLKAYVSRDDGTTYTQATLVGKGSYSGTTEIASAHDIDISGQPAGVTMRWKIETLVQSAALDTRLNGVSLGWS